MEFGKDPCCSAHIDRKMNPPDTRKVQGKYESNRKIKIKIMFAGKVSTKQNEYATKDPVSRL